MPHKGDLSTAQRIPSKAKVKKYEDYSRTVIHGGKKYGIKNTAAQEALLAKRAAVRKKKKN